MLFRRALVCLLLPVCAALLPGCATSPPASPAAPPPRLQLGPIQQLIPTETTSERVQVVIDPQGAAHVFGVSPRSREVYHVVVAPDGGVVRERVAAETAPTTLSAAFDHAGTLHLLLDARHLVKEGGQWRDSRQTPWGVLGIRVHGARFVPGARGLIWAFLVDGDTVGAQGRWDWIGFGGPMAAIVFPWHGQSTKLVLVAENGVANPVWHVLDPTDNRDASSVRLSADDSGTVYVAYDASRHLLVTELEPRQATIATAGPSLDNGDTAAAARTAHRLHAVRGAPLSLSGEGLSLTQAALCADPSGASVLLVRAHDASQVLAGGHWGAPIALPLTTFWEPRLAAAGDQSFHALVVGPALDEWTGQRFPLLYLRFAHGRWSGPVEIGLAAVSTFWGAIWDAVQVAGDGSSRAFAAWPTKNGISGRWIEVLP